jgi:two-component system LytT family response regulator
MNCIILDDEPLAIEVLRDYVAKVPYLACRGSFRDPVKALSFLRTHDVDLIFLDMSMPGLTGIQFLKSLTKQPFVIFTTAYTRYAVESYDFDAVDYLLKPIEFDRFCRAVNKAYELQEQKVRGAEAEHEDRKTVLIKSGTGYHMVHIDEIQFLKGTGNYVTFVTTQRKILSLLSLKQACEMLPASTFLRVHKSFIVNLDRIELIEKDKVKIGEFLIPIGESYRSAVLDRIRRT